MSAPALPSGGPTPQAAGAPRRRGWSGRLRSRRLLVAAACLLLVAGAGAVILYPYAVGHYHQRKARQALERHDFTAARAHLERCLEVWPRSGETNFVLARTCRRGDDSAAARDHLEAARGLGWPNDLIDLEYLLIEAQTGAVRPVERNLWAFLASKPSEEKIILEALVLGHLRGDQLDRAFACARLWVERHPDDWQGKFWQGRVLEQGLRLDLAAEAYQEALGGEPGHAEARLRLAEVLLRRNRFPQALPHFEEYLRVRPDDADGLLGLARCRRALGAREEARTTLERLSELHGERAPGLLLRGQLELDDGRHGQAVAWLRRALALAPHDREAHVALATALRQLGRADEARQHDGRVRQIDRDLRRVEQITKEVITDPDNVSLRQEAGTILLGLGQVDEAARWLVSALLLDPGHGPTKRALAECVRRLGDPNLAKAYGRLLGGGGP